MRYIQNEQFSLYSKGSSKVNLIFLLLEMLKMCKLLKSGPDDIVVSASGMMLTLVCIHDRVGYCVTQTFIHMESLNDRVLLPPGNQFKFLEKNSLESQTHVKYQQIAAQFSALFSFLFFFFANIFTRICKFTLYKKAK